MKNVGHMVNCMTLLGIGVAALSRRQFAIRNSQFAIRNSQFAILTKSPPSTTFAFRKREKSIFHFLQIKTTPLTFSGAIHGSNL
jgi:hypothetical protein